MTKPTGLNREALWQLLFLVKHRANPWQEQEYWGADWRDVWAHWRQAQYDMGIYKADLLPFQIDVDTASRGFIIENDAANTALEDSKAQHARRWQTKEGIYRVKEQYPDVRDEADVSMEDI